MKKIALFSAALFTFVAVQPYIVHAGDKAKVEHYEAKMFSNVEDAFAGLLSSSEEMARIAAEADLDGTKIEKIHQISYTTENAVAKLGEKSKYDLKPLAAALEDVHLASEEHDPADLKNKFITYQAELNSYLAQR